MAFKVGRAAQGLAVYGHIKVNLAAGTAGKERKADKVSWGGGVDLWIRVGRVAHSLNNHGHIHVTAWCGCPCTFPLPCAPPPSHAPFPPRMRTRGSSSLSLSALRRSSSRRLLSCSFCWYKLYCSGVYSAPDVQEMPGVRRVRTRGVRT